MHWVIQDRVFGDETRELVKHIKSYDLVKGSIYGFSGQYPYIIRGTTQFIQEIYKKWDDYSWMPNLLHLDNYECHKYYKEVALLLNVNFLLFPWWKLRCLEDRLFEYFETDRLFIRPNSGVKLFTGTTIGKKWFRKELEIIESLPSSKFDQQDLVLVAKFQEVWNECRFMMQKNKIVSWSPYGDSQEDGSMSEKDTYESYEQLVTSNGYYPDDFYTIDVGMTMSGPKIIEINSFVSAGLYNMDYSKVVKAVDDFYAKD